MKAVQRIRLAWVMGFAGLVAAGGLSSAAAAPMGSAYRYNRFFGEDFDQMGQGFKAPGDSSNTYWYVWANGSEVSSFLYVAPNAGGALGAYNAQGTAEDRHLQVYKTSTGETHYLIARFLNDTHRTLTVLPLLYDFESSWQHIVTTTNNIAAFTVGYQTNTTAAWANMGGTFNASVRGGNGVLKSDWMTDEQMLASGTLIRNKGGQYTLPAPLLPGATFYVRWFAHQAAGYLRMGVGIDNLLAYPVFNAAYPYTDQFEEDFSSMSTNGVVPGYKNRTYWSVTAGGAEWATNLVVATNGVNGSQLRGFNAVDDTTNHWLCVYKSQSNDVTRLTTGFYNATTQALDTISLQYDLRCGWTDATNAGKRAAFTVWYSTNEVDWFDMGAAFAAAVTDAGSPAATNWLTEAETVGGGLLARKRGGAFTPPAPVPVGDYFLVRWEATGGAGVEGMNFGIDNLRVPPPDMTLGPVLIVR